MTGMGAGPERKARWALLAGAMALITGCGSSLACSAVGCSSGLNVSGPHTIGQQRARWARICLATSCQTKAVSAGSGVSFLGGTSVDSGTLNTHDQVQVSVTLENAGRTRLLAASGSIRLRKIAPNGVKCGPVCYIGNVTIHPDGTLTATLAPS